MPAGGLVGVSLITTFSPLGNLPLSTTKVADIISKDLVCCSPQDDVSKAQKMMQEHKISRILCCDQNKKPVGVISLQGEAQAKLIEHKLLERLEPEVIEERRLICGDAARSIEPPLRWSWMSPVATMSTVAPLRLPAGPPIAAPVWSVTVRSFSASSTV